MCDFPEISAGYGRAVSMSLLEDHTIDVTVVTFAQSDGSMPHATDEDTSTNAAILQTAFNSLGIAFNFFPVTVNDSNLWSKYLVIQPTELLATCRIPPSGGCRDECKFEEFGWDSGKCLCPDQTACTSKSVCVCLAPALVNSMNMSATPDTCNGAAAGNGQCDAICNNPLYQWDHGDCCNAGSALCFDPQYAPGINSPSSFVELTDVG
jgi:hypothetical protein